MHDRCEEAVQDLKAQVAELRGQLAAAAENLAAAEGKLATAKEARKRSASANWRLRDVEKSLRAQIARLSEQHQHLKDSLVAHGQAARETCQTAGSIIASQSLALRGAGERVAVLAATLGPDLVGRPFADMLVHAAEVLEAVYATPPEDAVWTRQDAEDLAACLLAKAGEVEAVQKHADAPVQPAAQPAASLLSQVLALLEQEVRAETDYQRPEAAAVVAGVNRAILRVRDALRDWCHPAGREVVLSSAEAARLGASGTPMRVTTVRTYALHFHLDVGSPEEKKLFATMERRGITTNWQPPRNEPHIPGEKRPVSIASDDPDDLERLRIELAGQGIYPDAPAVGAP